MPAPTQVRVLFVVTQHPPPAHELRSQQTCPAPPHCAHTPFEHVAPFEHARPVQHCWPAAPHGCPLGPTPLDPPHAAAINATPNNAFNQRIGNLPVE